MTEHAIVTAAQAEIVAITEAWRRTCVERDQYRRERDEARALLIQHGLATADEATEPEDGGAA
jgi:hypothetical protein